MNIIEAIHDPALFGRAFKDPETWRAWLVYLRALFGLPGIEGEGLKLFQESTGLDASPAERIRESFVIAGRRSGKSFISAIIAVFLACFKDWKPYLAPGERGWIFIVATDKQQAGIIRRYIGGLLRGSVILRRMIEKETVESIDLRNGISIGVKTCSFRSLRGYTILCAILEELAFWRSEASANPDREILTAIRPALASIPESLLIGISTPYSRSGVLWNEFRTGFGRPGQTLVWKSDSLRMNPTLNADMIARALHEDPDAGRAEWGLDFRSDIAAFLSGEAVEVCIVPGRFELPRVQGVSYRAFLDPSGGRQDAFTLAVCHAGRSGRIVLDVLRERRPPFQPKSVVDEFAGVLKSYGLTSATSDRYAGEWPREAFGEHGISIEAAEKTASELYLELLPRISNQSVELLDNRRLVSQLVGLERRTRAGGKDLITHYPGGHDDLANAVAGAVSLISSGASAFFSASQADFFQFDGEEGDAGDVDGYMTAILKDGERIPIRRAIAEKRTSRIFKM